MRCWSRSRERLSRRAAADDIMARVGGDEFVLLLSPAGPVEEVARQASSHFLSRLKEPYFIDGSEIFISASVGVSLYPSRRALL